MEKKNGKIPEEDLKEIAKFARKELNEDEIYTFSLILCDNEVDRDGERFSLAALEKLSCLFVGKTGIFDHELCSKHQTARIYSCSVETDSEKMTSAGEPYTCLTAKAYMVRNEKNRPLIEEIEAGIKKETSINCSVSDVRCSVCGRDARGNECEHIKGRSYNGSVCHYILEEPADAYEWSFVAVPAQKNAGVIKSFTMGGSEDSALAEEYRTEMTALVVAGGADVLPELSDCELYDICSRLSLKQLRRLNDVFEKISAKKLPVIRQLEVKAEKADENIYRNYKI